MRRTTRSSNLGRSKCPRRPTTHHSITHHHHHHHHHRRRHHAHQPDPDLSLAGAPGPATEPPSLPRASFSFPTHLLVRSIHDRRATTLHPYFFFFFLSFRSSLYTPRALYTLGYLPLHAHIKLCRWRSARPCATLTDSLCVIVVQRLDLTRLDTIPPPRHRRLPPHAIRNPLPLSTYPPAVAAATATAVAVAILLPLGAPVRLFHLHSK